MAVPGADAEQARSVLPARGGGDPGPLAVVQWSAGGVQCCGAERSSRRGRGPSGGERRRGLLSVWSGVLWYFSRCV